IRTAGNPSTMATAIRQAVQAVDPDLPIYGIRTMEEQKSASLSSARLAANLLSFFGLLALLLASVGLYGVMDYSVIRRKREIGIRMALGAQANSVFKMVMTEGMILVVIGLALGTAGAIAASRLITGFLYNVSPTDPLTFVIIAAVMVGMAVIANYL